MKFPIQFGSKVIRLLDKSRLLKLPQTFDKASGNSSSLPIDEWLNKFNSISLCATWDDDRKLQILPSKLTSIAFDFHQQLLRTDPQSIDTFDRLARQLKNRFNDPTTQETYLNRFHTAYKLPSESLRDFAQRLEKLFYKSF